MSDLIRFGSVALECPDATALAGFYAEITGGEVTFSNPRWATVQGPNGRLDFQTAEGYRAPTWPDDVSSMQMHLDFDVDDLEAAGARVVAAGARRCPIPPNDHFEVYLDPVGHPFCLSSQDVV